MNESPEERFQEEKRQKQAKELPKIMREGLDVDISERSKKHGSEGLLMIEKEDEDATTEEETTVEEPEVPEVPQFDENGEVSFAWKIKTIKEWLETGSVNIFGFPMSGKDTVGHKLAEAIDGILLSSGMIIREMEKLQKTSISASGALVPTDTFYEWVLPYFDREDLKDKALVLSSIGRWKGEERVVIEKAKSSGHPIKVAVILNISETDVINRWVQNRNAEDRGDRADDKDAKVFQKRLEEFRDKTAPVIIHYENLGILIKVNAEGTKEEVFHNLVEKLYKFATKE